MVEERFDMLEVREALKGVFPGGELVYFPETVSTSDEAMARARDGAAEGTFVLAENQTAGRGRRGAAWFADPDTALLFSLVLRPVGKDVSTWARMTSVAALALARTIEDTTGLEPKIKWPNDIYIGGRKSAGILVEAAGDFLVLGIGLNVNTPRCSFPDALQGIATSLRAELGDGIAISRSALLAEFLKKFGECYPSMLSGKGFSRIIPEIEERSMLLNRKAIVYQGKTQLQGIVRGLGDHGELRMEVPPSNHPIEILSADRVRLAVP